MDIEEIRTLREEYEAALDVAEAKRFSYHQAIRKLYMSGVPLREIADQLGLSHQRVHQIVGEEPPNRKRQHRVVGVTATALVLLTGALFWAIVHAGPPHSGPVSGEGPSRRPALTVRVLAFDRSWRFDYEGEGVTVIGSPGEPPEMVIPAGRTVRLILISSDVIHSFWVPELLGKQDVVPGEPNHVDLQTSVTGVYNGDDVEFNQPNQDSGPFTIQVVTPQGFSQWLSAAQS